MRHLLVGLIAIIFVAGCGTANEKANRSESNENAKHQNAASAEPTLLGTWVLDQPTDDWMTPPIVGLISTIVIESGGKITETSKSSYESELTFTAEYRKISDKEFEVFKQSVKGTPGKDIEIEPYQITLLDADTMETSIDSTKLRYERRPRTTPAVKGSYIGIWKFKRPEESMFVFDEELLSQALEVKKDGWFMFSYLTKSGKLYEYEGLWKKVSATKIDFRLTNIELKDNQKISCDLLDSESLVINFPGWKKAQLQRATTDTVDYPATAAEKQKYVGVWHATNSIPQYTSEVQTLNADGTAVFDMTYVGGHENKLPGTWKLVSPDVVVITRKHVIQDGHFKCTARMIDKDTLTIDRSASNTTFQRKQ